MAVSRNQGVLIFAGVLILRSLSFGVYRGSLSFGKLPPLHIYICTIYACVNRHMSIHTYTYVCMYICIYIYICVYVY